jgi:hypothetical protein
VAVSVGGGPFWVLFWVRLVLVGIWVGVPVLLVGALVWLTTRRRAAAGRRVRQARLVGLGMGALVGVVAVWLAELWLAPVAVAAGYLSGVLNGELRGAPPTGLVRVASLQPRTASRYVPRGAVVVAVVAAVMTMLAPAVLTAVPTASYGPWQPFPGDPRFTLPGATLAWPPPALWLPLVVVAGGALIVGALLIRRVTGLPDQSGSLESTRRNAARTITGTVVGVELLALGALTLFASSGLAVPAPVGGGAYLASRILVWTGLGLAVAGIVVWCVLSRWRPAPLAPDAAAELPPA